MGRQRVTGGLHNLEGIRGRVWNSLLKVSLFVSTALTCGPVVRPSGQPAVVEPVQILERGIPVAVMAKLCGTCSFGSKADRCLVCGKPTFGRGVLARICDRCGFGSKKDNCVVCGKNTFGKGVAAHLCNQCSFGSKKDRCVLCGKRL